MAKKKKNIKKYKKNTNKNTTKQKQVHKRKKTTPVKNKQVPKKSSPIKVTKVNEPLDEKVVESPKKQEEPTQNHNPKDYHPKDHHKKLPVTSEFEITLPKFKSIPKKIKASWKKVTAKKAEPEKKEKFVPPVKKKFVPPVKKEQNKVELPKLKEDLTNKSVPYKIYYFIKKYIHHLFNGALLATFILLVTALITVHVFGKGTILYISAILLFLIAIAISYNKYISGKIFTVLLIIMMSMGIKYFNYNYDFINSLNKASYAPKTYYVVTFENITDHSIYTLNNKKVGLTSRDATNIKRKLNTKLNAVKYIEEDDLNKLFANFYNRKYKAVLVTKNQYKYLQNNIEPNHRGIKILYEFSVNSLK